MAVTCAYLTVCSLFTYDQWSLFLIRIIVCFKQYCPPMFLDSLTSPLTASSTSVTTTSPHESSTHVSSSSGRSETGVIASSGSNIPDVISLDWRRTRSILGIIHQNCSFLDLWSVEAIFLLITLIFIEMSDGFVCLLRDEHRWPQQEPHDMQGFFLLLVYSLSIRYIQL